MKNINPDSLPERFSEDPQENLRIENEILHLTLKAELGGELMHNNSELSPEVENEFLKNILEFEHAFADSAQIKVFDLLNRPAFKKASELDDEELPAALTTVILLLEEKNIVVEYIGEYDNRLKYAFITDEFFEHEMNDVQIPGMVTHFCYEEFHPNHKSDIEERAIEFISTWLAHDIDEYSSCLSDPLIIPGGTDLSRDEVLAKIKRTFEAYPAFGDHSYDVNDIHFEFSENSGAGLGYAEGTVKYTATLESGENMEISGPFKFYMCYEYCCWFIMYFVFPGFNWE